MIHGESLVIGNGLPFAALAPDEHYKYLGVRATVTGDFSAEKQYVLDEMRQRLTALKELL
jgi:hypothetical protein